MTEFTKKNRVMKMLKEWKTLECPPNLINKTAWVRVECPSHIQPLLHDGRIFRQTTTVFFGILCTAALYICFTLAGYWLETLYQSWYGVINFLPLCFMPNRISIQIWLKAAYCEYNCKHYLLPIVLTMFIVFWISVFIVFIFPYIFGSLYFCYLISKGGGLGID